MAILLDIVVLREVIEIGCYWTELQFIAAGTFLLLLLLLRNKKGALTGTICTWFAVAKKIRKKKT